MNASNDWLALFVPERVSDFGAWRNPPVLLDSLFPPMLSHGETAQISCISRSDRAWAFGVWSFVALPGCDKLLHEPFGLSLGMAYYRIGLWRLAAQLAVFKNAPAKTSLTLRILLNLECEWMISDHPHIMGREWTCR